MKRVHRRRFSSHSVFFRHNSAIVARRTWMVEDEMEPSCVKYPPSPHPAMLRSTNTHYIFSLRGMESGRERWAERDLAGDVKQNGSCFLPPLCHDAHLPFCKSLPALSWLLARRCFVFFLSLLLHVKIACPAPNHPPSTSPL